MKATNAAGGWSGAGRKLQLSWPLSDLFANFPIVKVPPGNIYPFTKHLGNISLLTLLHSFLLKLTLISNLKLCNQRVPHCSTLNIEILKHFIDKLSLKGKHFDMLLVSQQTQNFRSITVNNKIIVS